MSTKGNPIYYNTTNNFLTLSYFNATHTDKHKNYHMMFELADGGSLREYLRNHFKSLKWKDKYKLGLEVTSGLKHLHDLDIIHKDLVFITHISIVSLHPYLS